MSAGFGISGSKKLALSDICEIWDYQKNVSMKKCILVTRA